MRIPAKSESTSPDKGIRYCFIKEAYYGSTEIYL